MKKNKKKKLSVKATWSSPIANKSVSAEVLISIMKAQEEESKQEQILEKKKKEEKKLNNKKAGWNIIRKNNNEVYENTEKRINKSEEKMKKTEEEEENKKKIDDNTKYEEKTKKQKYEEKEEYKKIKNEEEKEKEKEEYEEYEENEENEEEENKKYNQFPDLYSTNIEAKGKKKIRNVGLDAKTSNLKNTKTLQQFFSTHNQTSHQNQASPSVWANASIWNCFYEENEEKKNEKKKKEEKKSLLILKSPSCDYQYEEINKNQRKDVEFPSLFEATPFFRTAESSKKQINLSTNKTLIENTFKSELNRQIEELMNDCGISLDTAIVDFLKSFNKSEEIVQFLKESITTDEKKKLEKFSQNFVYIVNQYKHQHHMGSADPPLLKSSAGNKGKKKKQKKVLDPSLLGFSVRRSKIVEGIIKTEE